MPLMGVGVQVPLRTLLETASDLRQHGRRPFRFVRRGSTTGSTVSGGGVDPRPTLQERRWEPRMAGDIEPPTVSDVTGPCGCRSADRSAHVLRAVVNLPQGASARE